MQWKERPIELIVIPRMFGFTFAQAFHNKLNHPNPTQMQKQFSKQYFLLDQAKVLQSVFESCTYPCVATKILPKETMQYSTTTKPDFLGQHYSADVLEESKQRILVIRENLTSYTDATLIANQTKAALKNGIITLIARMKLGDNCLIRIDNHSSLASLKTDKSLEPMGIKLITGYPKNINKNATAEKAIRELREQMVKLSPHGGQVDSSTLARAVAFLNDIIRHSGFSAKELLYSREKTTGTNITLKDEQLSQEQHDKRLGSHASSASYSSRNSPPVTTPSLAVGDLVFIKSERSKSKARDSYMVISLDHNTKIACIQKFPMSNFRHHPIQVEFQDLYLAKRKENLPGSLSFQDFPNPCDSASPFPLTKSKTRLPKPRYDLSSSESESNPSSSDSESILDPIAPQPLPFQSFPTPPTEETTSDNSLDLSDISHEQEDASNSQDPDDDESSSSENTNVDVEDSQNPSDSTFTLKQPSLGQPNYLKAGDYIVMVKDGYWQRAKLLSHAGKKNKMQGSLYWNIAGVDEDWTLGCFLHPGESWGVLTDADQITDFSGVTFVQENESSNQEEDLLEEEVA